jgi:hypothetical protein
VEERAGPPMPARRAVADHLGLVYKAHARTCLIFSVSPGFTMIVGPGTVPCGSGTHTQALSGPTRCGAPPAPTPSQTPHLVRPRHVRHGAVMHERGDDVEDCLQHPVHRPPGTTDHTGPRQLQGQHMVHNA